MKNDIERMTRLRNLEEISIPERNMAMEIYQKELVRSIRHLLNNPEEIHSIHRTALRSVWERARGYQYGSNSCYAVPSHTFEVDIAVKTYETAAAEKDSPNELGYINESAVVRYAVEEVWRRARIYQRDFRKHILQ